MKTYKSFLIVIIVLQFIICNTYGQISTKELPVSFNTQSLSAKSIIPAANKIMPTLNMTAIHQEDASDEANGLPPRFGYPHPVNYNLNNSGEWISLPNGDKIWRLNIRVYIN
jgi:hypothetical protein